MNADERADRIKAIARQLITRVRDDDPPDVWRWLRLSMADLASADPIDDWVALSVVQACATPDDQTWSDLVAWIEPPESPVERRRRQLREAQQRRRDRCHTAGGYDMARPTMSQQRDRTSA